MNNNHNPRKKFIKLYNPNEEGPGKYDINYINAYKKNKNFKEQDENLNNERYAA